MALDLARTLHADVLLLDAGVLAVHDPSLPARIHASTRTRVLLVCPRCEVTVSAALAQGIKGCLLKSCAPEQCVRAIRAVHAGKYGFRAMCWSASSTV